MFLLGALGAGLPWRAPLAQTRSRVGYLAPGTPPDANMESVRDGLRRLGYEEGRNLTLVIRYAEGRYERFPALADELIRGGIDVLVAVGPAARRLQEFSRAVPTVFMFSGDAVAAGFVDSLARPGRNVTGMSYMVLDLAGKRIELLKELVPGLSRLGILSNPAHAGEPAELKVTLDAARNLGLSVDYRQIHTAADFVPSYAALVASGCNGVTAFSEIVSISARQQIAVLAAVHRLPSVFGLRLFTEVGGLISYGPVIAQAYARLAVYIDKILRGTPAAELPVEQPSVFEMVVNNATARALGIEVPRSILARADEVIE